MLPEEHSEEMNQNPIEKEKPTAYRVNLPYPKPVIIECNKKWASLLLEDYAGNASELTAILQYIYGDFVLCDQMPHIAKALKCIAIVEMGHLELLAGVIHDLGTNPKYQTTSMRGADKNWTPDFLCYYKDVGSVLLNNIDAETKSIAQYKSHVRKIDHAQIKELLLRIIMDEELHVAILKDLYHQYTKK